MQNISVNDIVRATGGVLLCGDGNTEVVSISTNSREIGEKCLFVPIIGEKVDAHRFIGGAIEQGAVAVLTMEHDSMESQIPYIRVEDSVKAIQAIGRYYNGLMKMPKVGITGSVGKTTTKEMIACALSAGKNVFKTSGNSNSQIGVPITVTQMDNSYDVAVIEMGMSNPGEMSILASIVNLNACVFTNIGVSHIENLGSQDNICREKFHITDALEEGGLVFLNGDDPILMKHRDELTHASYTFGKSEGCDYRAINIQNVNNGVEFDAVFDGRTYRVRLNVPGDHNVLNALVAIAVSGFMGVDTDAAIKSLSEYEGIKMRQQIYLKNNITFIDDSYNASPESMKAGINVLCSINAEGRRIAVLADMLELGSNSPEYHRETGRYIAGTDVTDVLLFGEMATCIGEGIKAHSSINVTSFANRDEIIEYLKKNLLPGDAVLFKGSRGMKLNEVADCFIK